MLLDVTTTFIPLGYRKLRREMRKLAKVLHRSYGALKIRAYKKGFIVKKRKD